MNEEKPSPTEQTTKFCPHCKKEVPKGAKKCPYCQSDLRHFLNRHPIVSALGIFFIVGIIMSAINDGHSTSSNTATAAPTGPAQARTLGQEAFLRLPDNSDEKQLICLAPNSKVYDEYGTALMAKDYQGILDLTDEGLFCVHNGSEVKVIDTTAFLTKVRVVKGADKVDADKVGEAGYTAAEWVVAQ